jgi:hypothetical protein
LEVWRVQHSLHISQPITRGLWNSGGLWDCSDLRSSPACCSCMRHLGIENQMQLTGQRQEISLPTELQHSSQVLGLPRYHLHVKRYGSLPEKGICKLTEFQGSGCRGSLPHSRVSSYAYHECVHFDQFRILHRNECPHSSVSAEASEGWRIWLQHHRKRKL